MNIKKTKQLWETGTYCVVIKHGYYGANQSLPNIFNVPIGDTLTIKKIFNDTTIAADTFPNYSFERKLVKPFITLEEAKNYSKRIKALNGKKFFTKKNELDNSKVYKVYSANYTYYVNRNTCLALKTKRLSNEFHHYDNYIYIEASKEDTEWFNKCVEAGKYLEKEPINYYSCPTNKDPNIKVMVDKINESDFIALEKYINNGTIIYKSTIYELTGGSKATQEEINYFLKHKTLTTFKNNKILLDKLIAGEYYKITFENNPEWNSLFQSEGGTYNKNRLYITKPEFEVSHYKSSSWVEDVLYHITKLNCEEKHWIQCCEQEDKFISLEDSKKMFLKNTGIHGETQKEFRFNKGDYVVLLTKTEFGLNYVYKIRNTSINFEICLDNKGCKTNGYDSIAIKLWNLKTRPATEQEINLYDKLGNPFCIDDYELDCTNEDSGSQYGNSCKQDCGNCEFYQLVEIIEVESKARRKGVELFIDPTKYLNDNITSSKCKPILFITKKKIRKPLITFNNKVKLFKIKKTFNNKYNINIKN